MASEALLRNRRIKTNPTKITVSGTAAENGTALPKGIYSITSDTDVYFLQGGSTVTATTSSNPLWSKERAEVEVSGDAEQDAFISVIQQSAGGSLWITLVSA